MNSPAIHSLCRELCAKRVGKVLVLCPKPLVRLFKNCPFIDDASDSFSESDFDEHVAIMSLPHLFETELETVPASVPYLHVEPQAKKKWVEKLSGLKGLKVGLVWAGNAREGQINANAIDRRRSLNLEQLLPLLDVKKLPSSACKWANRRRKSIVSVCANASMIT